MGSIRRSTAERARGAHHVNNQNVRQAEAQFRQARALVGAARANYYPVIGTSPSASQSDAGKNTGRAAGASQSFVLPIDATWEPDLWGRVRLSVEHAASEAQVSAADLESVRLSEQALLATDYFSLAAADMQQELLRDTIDAYEKNLKLTVDRFNGGVASRADITLAQTQLAGAKAQSTDLRIARAEFEHAIATLTAARRPISASGRRGSTCRRRRFPWPCRRSCSSGGPTSPPASGWWPPRTRTSGSRGRPTTRR